MADLSRRELLEKDGVRFVGALAAIVLVPTCFSLIFSGCGPSKGSSPTTGGGGGGGGGGTNTTVMAALTSKVGNVGTRSTSNGSKIISAGSVSGENIVFTVNGLRNDSVAPASYNVRTGDVVDFFDLNNGSRLSFVVS